MKGLFLNIGQLGTVIDALNFVDSEGLSNFCDDELKVHILDYFKSIGYEY